MATETTVTNAEGQKKGKKGKTGKPQLPMTIHQTREAAVLATPDGDKFPFAKLYCCAWPRNVEGKDTTGRAWTWANNEDQAGKHFLFAFQPKAELKAIGAGELKKAYVAAIKRQQGGGNSTPATVPAAVPVAEKVAANAGS